MKKNLLLLLLLLSSLLIAGTVSAQYYGANDKEKLIQALHAVSENDINEWMHILIAPEMRGRLAGDIGYDLAAQWAADSLAAWGLKPFPGFNGYFQEFPQPYTLIHEKGSLSIVDGKRPASIIKEYAYADDYFPSGLSGSGSVVAEVVYAGFCIVAPELGYNDFSGIDVKGKILICEQGSPYTGNNPDTLEMWYPFTQSDYKIRQAAQLGAKGILMAYHAASPRPTVLPDMLYLSVADNVVSDIIAGSGNDLGQIREGIRSSTSPFSFNTGTTVAMEVVSSFHPEGKTSNVVAIIEGSDPGLKNEYMILGAHLDHLGMMPVLFPGALDNASGVSIAMGVARAIATSGIELKRSLVILLFGAEEVGLVGSTWFVNHFPFPKDRIRMMINLDMVGRGNSLFAATSDLWKELLPYFERNNEAWVHRPMMTRSGPWAYSFRPRTDGAVFPDSFHHFWSQRRQGSDIVSRS